MKHWKCASESNPATEKSFFFRLGKHVGRVWTWKGKKKEPRLRRNGHVGEIVCCPSTDTRVSMAAPASDCVVQVLWHFNFFQNMIKILISPSHFRHFTSDFQLFTPPWRKRFSSAILLLSVNREASSCWEQIKRISLKWHFLLENLCKSILFCDCVCVPVMSPSINSYLLSVLFFLWVRLLSDIIEKP